MLCWPILFPTDDANQIHRVVNALNAGTVWVNQYNILHNNVPFG
jgi:aldehyde dehydrogenase (NAD+)